MRVAPVASAAANAVAPSSPIPFPDTNDGEFRWLSHRLGPNCATWPSVFSLNLATITANPVQFVFGADCSLETARGWPTHALTIHAQAGQVHHVVRLCGQRRGQRCCTCGENAGSIRGTVGR
jgi:hypothetical protein